jgi:lipoate-protein ligase A
MAQLCKLAVLILEFPLSFAWMEIRQYLNWHGSTPEENLACDEALLEECDNGIRSETLRIWESDRFFAVIGYGQSAVTELNQSACEIEGLPILRRCSGGGAVIQGPGCLNYSILLNISQNPSCSTVAGTNTWIMEQNRKVVEQAMAEKGCSGSVKVCGASDLTLDGLKFSGNAQRRFKNALLFHGTFLFSVDISLWERYLRFPSQQPDYRQNRSHNQFVTPLPLKREDVILPLRQSWAAQNDAPPPPLERIRDLIHEKYGNKSWVIRR